MKINKIITMGIAAIMAVSAATSSVIAEDLSVPENEVIFEEDDLMNENSISPEEFAELTGITMRTLSDKEAAEMEMAEMETAKPIIPSASIDAATIPFELTWGATKPWLDAHLWGWSIVYDLDTYYVDSSAYTAKQTSNTYSQQVVTASAGQGMTIKAAPTDSSSSPIRFYVHVVDRTTFAETTLPVFTVTNATTTQYISNPKNKEMYIVINIANSQSTTRKGEVTLKAY